MSDMLDTLMIIIFLAINEIKGAKMLALTKNLHHLQRATPFSSASSVIQLYKCVWEFASDHRHLRYIRAFFVDICQLWGR